MGGWWPERNFLLGTELSAGGLSDLGTVSLTACLGFPHPQPSLVQGQYRAHLVRVSRESNGRTLSEPRAAPSMWSAPGTRT